MGMANNPVTVEEVPCGMADRVHFKRNGHQVNAGLSFVLPVCEDCGALVIDQKRHDDFHEWLRAGL